MTRVLWKRLAMVVVAAFLGLFFVFGLGGGEQKILARFMMIVWLVLMVLAWKPLHKRFQAWAILISYLQVGFPLIIGVPLVITGSDPSMSLSSFSGIMLFAIFSSVVFLLLGRQKTKPKPIEQRRPDLASMVINGHWELLAQEGLPSDEIERLKRMTKKERADLWATLTKGRRRYSSARKITSNRDDFFDDFDNFGLNDYSGFSLGSPWHKTGYDDD